MNGGEDGAGVLGDGGAHGAERALGMGEVGSAEKEL